MWRRFNILLLSTLLALVAVRPAASWDETGHEVVAYIAWQHMTPEARAAVSRILQFAPPQSDLLDLRPQSGGQAAMMHFVRSAYWPDIVRDTDFEERYERYHMGPWHYTNTFWEETADGGVRIRTDLQPADVNIVERLHRLDELARSDLVASAQKAIIIAWLGHLVGDIHQPLHASARVTAREPEGDLGGNLFNLEGEDNLHWYWDRALSDAFERQIGESELAYTRRVAESLMTQHDPAVDSEFNYDDWAERSFEIASEDLYDQIERGGQPPVAYQEMAQATAAESIVLAGRRLGALMNSLFG